MPKVLAPLFLLAFLLATCTIDKKDPFPKTHWASSTPESQGINSEILQQALSVLEGYCGEDGIEEALIIRNGFLVFRGDSVEKSHGVWSCTKSFTSTALGLLVQDGLVPLDDNAWTYAPVMQDKYPDVTLRHFTTMTSGYNAVGRSRWGEDSQDWSINSFEPDEPLFEPGTGFA